MSLTKGGNKMKTVAKLLLMTLVAFMLHSSAGFAAAPGVKEGAASLLIPGWGQYMNGDFDSSSGRMKVGGMAALELAAIITTAVVGGVAGYPQVWVGIGLFIANHVWSGLDAFINAKSEPGVNLGTAAPHSKIETAQ
jgi:hypothetical protein